MISKYECYDRFSKGYVLNSDDYRYIYDCPLCRECPFFKPKWVYPCKLHREEPNKTWNDIKVLVESMY